MSGSFEKKQTTASALEGPDTLLLIAFLWVLLARFLGLDLQEKSEILAISPVR